MDELNDFSVESDFYSDKFREIKVALKSPLKRTFWYLSILSFLAIGFAWFLNVEKELTPQTIGVMIVYTGCLVFFTGLYFNTDNFYVFDLESKQIFHHFKFFFYKKVRFFANFSDVHAVTLTGRNQGSYFDASFNYRVKAILNSGECFYLSDETYEGQEKQTRIARKISAITGAELVKSFPGCNAVPKKSGERFSFSFYECSWLDTTKQNFIEVVAGIAFIAIIIAVGKNGSTIVKIFKSIFG